MEATQQSKMGTMPVGRLLLSVSTPIVISMLVQALYNVVDSIFVARLSEDALTAVSLVFPVQNLMIAVGVGTAVGVSSLLGRRLGERDTAAVNRAASNGLFLAVLSFVLFAVVGLAFSRAYFAGYAADSLVGQAVANMGETYMLIVTVASPGLFMALTLDRLLQATGRSMLAMASQMSGAITNIVLDPIMIFGLLGFPAMGVAGAALATVIGQWVSMVVSFLLNRRLNQEIRIHIRGFRPNPKTIKHIYAVGLPSIVMQAIGSVMVFGMNAILVAFGTTPVSVLGVYFKLQSFILMPVFGVNNGMVAVVAYNYGARKPKRIERAIQLSMLACIGIMVAGMVLFWVLPKQLLGLFDAGPEMMEIGTLALRTICFAFPLTAVSVVFVGVFQALGQGLYSLIMSVVRQLVFILPLAWLLAVLSGLSAVWIAFPIAELLAIIPAVFFFRAEWRRKIVPLAEADAVSEAVPEGAR